MATNVENLQKIAGTEDTRLYGELLEKIADGGGGNGGALAEAAEIN